MLSVLLPSLVVFPTIATSVLALFFIKKLTRRQSALLSIGAILTSCVASWVVFLQVAFHHKTFAVSLFPFINLYDFTSYWQIYIDQLTAIMLIVVTTVSLMVHIYSVGYMSHDKSPQRFMAYLGLFTFFMLALVTAGDFLQLFVGWEGVGLSSYLLIGFWHHKDSANKASMKAFITNRFADMAFVLALAAIYLQFGSLRFADVLTSVELVKDRFFVLFGSEIKVIDFIAMTLFIGAMGKSAQLFLHVWLPDAMEGPTPVSALIHAATMVTAGVFLVARTSELFQLSHFTLNFMTIIGALTAIFAATIALVQSDIKKIIAYSTCSQLGYMFFAAGVGAYSASVFHLFTHAFFKALLFLCAGSVIHAVSDNQDIFKMGGLWKKIPLTFALMMIGTIAITGFYPLAGYYSKDAILESAFMSHADFGKFAFVLGCVAAFLTSFYSFRLIAIVFHGKFKDTREVESRIHESPFVMTFPLLFLSVFAVLSGAFGYYILHILGDKGHFWEGSIFVDHHLMHEIHNTPKLIKKLPMILSTVAGILAYFLYLKGEAVLKSLNKLFKPIKTLLEKKYYFDEVYEAIFVKPARRLSIIFTKIFDFSVDFFITKLPSAISLILAKGVRTVQNGMIRNYSVISFGGLVVALLLIPYIK